MMKARPGSKSHLAVCSCGLRTSESSRGAAANSTCRLDHARCRPGMSRICKLVMNSKLVALKLAPEAGSQFPAESMCRLFLTAVRPIYAPISAELKGALCAMAINFHWEHFGGQR